MHISMAAGDYDGEGWEGYFVGSPSYASRRMLCCDPASYRDGAWSAAARCDPAALCLTRSCAADLESVFYVLAELVMGEQLPWSCKDENSASDGDGDEIERASVSFRRACPCGCAVAPSVNCKVTDWCLRRAGRQIAHYAYDMSLLLRRLPPVMQTMWGMIEALQFGEVPDYDDFRATLLPAMPAVRTRGAKWPAVGAPAGLAKAPTTGPTEPNGKRLRAAIAASMQREE